MNTHNHLKSYTHGIANYIVCMYRMCTCARVYMCTKQFDYVYENTVYNGILYVHAYAHNYKVMSSSMAPVAQTLVSYIYLQIYPPLKKF